jgi:hypothetical protein
MKIGLLIGPDSELGGANFLGIAITYWRRWGAKWHVGFRVSVCLGGTKQYGIRFSNYACPKISTPGVVTPSKCVMPPQKRPNFL